MLSDFEKKRLEYMIKEANKGTFIQVGKGDAELLMKLYKPIKDKDVWDDVLNKVKEELKEN